MNDPRGVRRRHRGRGWQQDVRHLRWVQATSRPEVRPEVLPLEEFHDQVRHAQVHADLEYFDDIRVPNRGGSAPFTQKTCRRDIALREVLVEELDGYLLSQDQVARLEHRSHAAGAQQAHDLV